MLSLPAADHGLGSTLLSLFLILGDLLCLFFGVALICRNSGRMLPNTEGLRFVVLINGKELSNPLTVLVRKMGIQFYCLSLGQK